VACSSEHNMIYHYSREVKEFDWTDEGVLLKPIPLAQNTYQKIY
jgi:hypothetical protein